ncbi:hypothetical protein B5S31_g2743 [[Candida] boidinii]|nr:hypothetical protein B5S31_g2743 [[Candida] boidinii]
MAECKFEFNSIDEKTNCFSPSNPLIDGKLNIKFNSKLDKIKEINLRFEGFVKIIYHHEYYTTSGGNGGTGRVQSGNERKIEILSDIYQLFDYSQPLINHYHDTDNDTKRNGFKFIKGDSLDYDIGPFYFPYNEVLLPSSFALYTGKWGILVSYTLTVEFKRIRSFFKRDILIKDYLNYQGGFYKTSHLLTYYSPTLSGDLLIPTDKNKFDRKPKELVIDTGTNMVKNPLKSRHRNTRFIRSLFDDNYKSSNYKNLTKDVELKLLLISNNQKDNSNFFNINDSLSKFGKLFIEVQDLTNLIPDFKLNNDSTGLGKFYFKSLELDLVTNVTLRAKYSVSDTLKFQQRLIEKDYKTPATPHNKFHEIKFDIADFHPPDKYRADSNGNFNSKGGFEYYFKWFNLSEFLNDSDKLPQPLATSCRLGDYALMTYTMEWRFEIMYSFNNVTKIKDFRLIHDVVITNNEINIVPGGFHSFAPIPFTNNVVDRNPPPAFTNQVDDRNPPPIYANADTNFGDGDGDDDSSDSSNDSSDEDGIASQHSNSAYPPVNLSTNAGPLPVPATPTSTDQTTMASTSNFAGQGYGSSREINESTSNSTSNTTSTTHISDISESRAVPTTLSSNSTPTVIPPIPASGNARPALPPKPTQDELVRSNTITNFSSNTRSVPPVPQRTVQPQMQPPTVPQRSTQPLVRLPVIPQRVNQSHESPSGSPLQSNNPFSSGTSTSMATTQPPPPPPVPSGPPPLLGVTDPNVSALYDPLPPFAIQNYLNLGNIDFNNILGSTNTPIVPGFSRNDFPEITGQNGETKIENFNDRYTEDNYNRTNNDNNVPIEEEMLGVIHDYKRQSAFNYTHEMIARNYPHAILQGQMSLGLTEAALKAGMKKPNFDLDKITKGEDLGGVNEKQLNDYINHMVGVMNDEKVQNFIKATGMVNADIPPADKEMNEKFTKSLKERGVIEIDLEDSDSGSGSGGISGLFKKKKKKTTIEFKPNKEVLELLKKSELYRNS